MSATSRPTSSVTPPALISSLVDRGCPSIACGPDDTAVALAMVVMAAALAMVVMAAAVAMAVLAVMVVAGGVMLAVAAVKVAAALVVAVVLTAAARIRSRTR